MPTALVTGATGFVGSNLVAELRHRDWDVRCLVRDALRAKSLEELGATLHIGKLGEEACIQQSMSGVDFVFHVAGRVRALSDAEFEQDNVQGTRNIVSAAAAQTEPPVVVMVSSLAAGGPSKPSKPRSETDEDQPISAYGKSKLAAERAAAELADEVPISIIRPPIIFGPADKASLEIFRGVKLTRLHPVPGFREFPVSLVHVADLCDAMIRIAERGSRVSVPKSNTTDNNATNQKRTNSGVYYIAAERSIPYAHLGKLAAEAVGCTGIAVPIPKAAFWLIGGVAEVYGQLRREPAVLNLDKIREAVAPAWECCDEKLREELDYRPAATLEERFAATANWYRDNGWL